MIGLEVLSEWLATTVEMILYFSILHTLAAERFKRKKQIYFMVLVVGIIAAGVVVLNFIDISFSLPTLLYGVFALACGSCILYRGRFLEYLFISICFVTGLNVIELILVFLMQQVGMEQILMQSQQGFSSVRVYFIAAFKAIEIVFTIGVCRLLKAIKPKMKVTYVTLVCAFLGFFVVIYWIYQMVSELQLEPERFQTVLSICCVFMVCSGYFYLQMREIKREKDDTELQNQILERNYRVAEESYESNAQLYHDMRNHFSMLQSYLADGKVSQAQEYLGKISKISSGTEEHWTGIDAVDYILAQKTALAKRENIEIEIHAEYPRECKIDPVDLCTILTNLLDNAIESCGKQPEGMERNIKVTIRRIHQFIIIKIENSSIHEPIIKNGTLVTTKADSQYHGWGVKSVKAAAAKYHGTVEYEYKDAVFNVNVMLFYQ